MSKREQLIEYITQDIIDYQVSDNDLSIPDAMTRFYNSEVFEKLQDIETGLYLCSSAYVYDMLISEIENGKLLQREI